MATVPDLLDRDIVVQVTLAGFPGLMTLHATWDTGPATLPEHMVYFVRRGRIRLDDHLLGAGACALVPPDTRFRASAVDGAAAIMRCRLGINRKRNPVAAIPEPAIRQRAWELEPVVAMLIDAASQSSDRTIARTTKQAEATATDDRARCLAVLLVSGLSHATTDNDGLDARQRRALADHVARHRAHGLAPADLAAHLGLTHDYFTRRFRLTYGMAPRPWLLRERIRAACALLAEGDAPLDQVAASLGYDDLKLFGRQFRQVMGTPPGRWRRRSGSRQEDETTPP